jgi:DNA repair exonuclease SbcCD ATPase subunit
MLTLKSLQWNNCFSYGNNNIINFTDGPLHQLMGSNGSGKTSISLILQEVLYGKNIKNIKKQDISNNKSGIQGYDIILDFNKDGDEYKIILNRKTNLKLQLLKNGEDISSHTSLNTYKTIAEILGISDFKTFCQLIYQHSTDSLDFLTATDTNRKKFLIGLLQLDKYLEFHELFKEKAKLVNLDISKLEGSITTITSWIDRHKNLDFSKKELKSEIEYPEVQQKELNTIIENLNNINSINRQVHTNNSYIKELSNLDSHYYLNSPPSNPGKSSSEIRMEAHVLKAEKMKYLGEARKFKEITSKSCPTCHQIIDENILKTLNKKYKRLIIDLEEKIKMLEKEEKEALFMDKELIKYSVIKGEFVRLNNAINYDLPKEALDKHDLLKKQNELQETIKTILSNIKDVETYNIDASIHNSKIDVIKKQLEEMREELKEKTIELVEKENLLEVLEILKKTFGTNGLVSYKIESSIKELEKKINKYLTDLTHFQIYFKLSGEKLNIEVLDDSGNVTSISNLSSGERARVNIATILAIRNILSSLTSTKINLLFLDEVIGVIDSEGKEKLSEILLRENLNTFIVSHDWNHPLIPKINIIKENNISRIEN